MKTVVNITLCLLLTGIIAQAQLTTGEAIYLIGRQQALAQQIARSYIAIELKVDTRNYKILLEEGVALYEKNLKEIEQIKVNKVVASAIEQMVEDWDNFYKELTDAPQEAEVLNLVKQSKALLDASDQVLIALDDYAKDNEQVDARSLNTLRMIERQNGLSQHAILYYLAYANEVPVSELFADFQRIISEYESTFLAVTEAIDELPEMKGRLKESTYEWGKISGIITDMKTKPQKSALKKVLTTSDYLFNEANEIAKQYQKMVDVGQATTD